MFRTAATVLALAVLGVAANANAAGYSYTVSPVGKSPAEVKAAVTDAAYKACNEAYANDVFIAYKREACVRDSVQAALAKAPLAANTGAVMASR